MRCRLKKSIFRSPLVAITIENFVVGTRLDIHYLSSVLLIVFAEIAVVLLFSFPLCAQQKISLKKEGNTFTVGCKINSTTVDMILDTGADLVCIPEQTFQAINREAKRGSIKALGRAQMLDAAGNTTEVMSVRFLNFEIAGHPISSVDAFVIPGTHALLGQSALSKLGLIQIDYASETLTFFPRNKMYPTEPSVEFPSQTQVGRLELGGSIGLKELKEARIGSESENIDVSSEYISMDSSGNSWIILRYHQLMAHAGYDRLVLFSPISAYQWKFAAYFRNATFDINEKKILCHDLFEDDELTYFHSCRACNVDYPNTVFPVINFKVERQEVVAIPQPTPLNDIIQNLQVLSRKPIPKIIDDQMFNGRDDGTRKAFAINVVSFYRRTLNQSRTRELFFQYYKGEDSTQLWGEISFFCRSNARTKQ